MSKLVAFANCLFFKYRQTNITFIFDLNYCNLRKQNVTNKYVKSDSNYNRTILETWGCFLLIYVCYSHEATHEGNERNVMLRSIQNLFFRKNLRVTYYSIMLTSKWNVHQHFYGKIIVMSRNIFRVFFSPNVHAILHFITITNIRHCLDITRILVMVYKWIMLEVLEQQEVRKLFN